MCFSLRRDKRIEVIRYRLAILHKYCEEQERHFFLLIMNQTQVMAFLQKLIKFYDIDSKVISVRDNFQLVK